MTNLQMEVMKKEVESIEKEAVKGNHGKRWIQNRVDKITLKHEQITNALSIENIDIQIEWKKSSTWGMNPTATVNIYCKNEKGYTELKRYTAKASGCGYDKESASIASALNQSPEFKKLAYEIYENNKENPYGISFSEYGVHLEGGVGVNCYRNVFEYLGYNWKSVAWGKTFNVYSVTK